tara:strand:+ start:49 stop:378 length:330 start_codon:yes stop_codon:yes gene_type:complete
MAHTILHTWKERDKKANKPKKKKKEVSAAKQQAASRKGWKYGDTDPTTDTENYSYMGRVPDPNAKKNIGRPPELKKSHATVRAWAPVKKAKGGSVKKYARGGGVRKART